VLEILASSLTDILHSLTKLHFSPQPVTIAFVNFAVSCLTSICQLLVLLLPLSFTPNLITVFLPIYYKLPKSQLSRLRQIVLSLKLVRPVISFTSYALCTGSESLDASNTYKLLSLAYIQRSHNYPSSTTTQPPYLHNLVSVQRPRSTRFSFVFTLALPPSSSSLRIPDRSFRYASPCLWNQLRSISSSTSFWYQFFHFQLPYSPTTFSSSDSPLCSSITQSIFHSRLKTYLFHKILSSIVSLLHPGLPSRTVSSELLFVLLVSPYFIVFVPCARLRRSFRQL